MGSWTLTRRHRESHQTVLNPLRDKYIYPYYSFAKWLWTAYSILTLVSAPDAEKRCSFMDPLHRWIFLHSRHWFKLPQSPMGARQSTWLFCRAGTNANSGVTTGIVWFLDSLISLNFLSEHLNTQTRLHLVQEVSPSLLEDVPSTRSTPIVLNFLFLKSWEHENDCLLLHFRFWKILIIIIKKEKDKLNNPFNLSEKL